MLDLFAQDPPPGGFEVLVADGLSDDGTREILTRLSTQHAALRVIENPGVIVAIGLNAAIKEARGDIIIRMDVHSSYARDYLCQCVAVLQQTGADNVGGPWIARGSASLSRTIAAAFQNPLVGGAARGHDPRYEGPVDTVYLGCWRRSAFDRFGSFDEELVRNQDDEHNLRIIRKGGRVWQSPKIRSWYYPRNSLSSLFRQYAQYGYWKVRVIQKHRLPASIRHLVPGAFVGLVLVCVALAPMWSWARAGLGLLIAAYMAVNVMGSIASAAHSEWRLLPLLPAVIAGYQIGYGFGFLCGVWDFVVLRRGASDWFVQLTRGAIR